MKFLPYSVVYHAYDIDRNMIRFGTFIHLVITLWGYTCRLVISNDQHQLSMICIGRQMLERESVGVWKIWSKGISLLVLEIPLQFFFIFIKMAIPSYSLFPHKMTQTLIFTTPIFTSWPEDHKTMTISYTLTWNFL